MQLPADSNCIALLYRIIIMAEQAKLHGPSLTRQLGDILTSTYEIWTIHINPQRFSLILHGGWPI